MRLAQRLAAISLALLFGPGCDAPAGGDATPTAKTAAAVSTSGSPGPAGTTTAAATAAVKAPEGYDLGAIKPIPDGCKSAGVVVSTAPKSVGPDYGWPFARQALYANRQFRVYTEEGGMGGPMTVRFRRYQDPKSGSYTLVAECEDGKTCNELAAMFKATVRSSNPQPFCGKVPVAGEREYAPVHPQKASWVPEDGDTIGQCARIGACMIAADRSTPGDPALECQKAPSKFKLGCAKKEPCSEVVACLGK